MPQIDRFIDRLFEEGAEGLSFASGRPVVLTVDGQEMTLGSQEPDTAQVEALLREIAPAEQAGALADRGRLQFSYDAPAGEVDVRAYRTESSLRFWVVPAEDAGGAARGNGASAGTAAETAAAANGAGPEPVTETGPGPKLANETGPGTGLSTDDGAQPNADVGPSSADGLGEQEADGKENAARAGVREAGENGVSPDVPDAGRVAEDPAAGRVAEDPAAGRVAEDPGAPEATVAPGDAPAIDRLLRRLVELGGSDLHLSPERVPQIRKDGQMEALEGEDVISAARAEEMLLEIAPERNREEFASRSDTDFAHEIPGLARFRSNLFRDLNGVGGVFRVIPSEIMTVEDLGLPDPILDLCKLSKGLVVVTGPTGSGKSTTLAAMIDYINRTRSDHIITIEDPVEFVHPNKKCLINQREVGVHTQGFKVALRAALREDPDIVLVGEMRDLETVHIALETAETGHLVFGTLHTNTAPSTVDRVIDQFPSHQQEQIRAMLSESLRGVIAQTLCRRKEGGRVAAMEVLLVTPAVSNLIREGKTFQIPSVMQTGRQHGMKTMNDSLLELVQEGIVTVEEAYHRAVARAEFKQLLSRNGLSLDG